MKKFLVFVFAVKSFSVLAQTYKTLVPFRKGNLFGYSDLNKNIVINPQFDVAEFFDEKGVAYVVKGKTGFFINMKGKPLKNSPSIQALPVKESEQVVEEKMIPSNIKTIYRNESEGLNIFNNLNGKYKNLVWLTRYYRELCSKSLNYYCFGEPGHLQLLDEKENICLPFEFDSIRYRYDSDLCDGYFNVKKNSLYGLYKAGGAEIVPFISESIPPVLINDSISSIWKDKKVGFYNRKQQKIVINPQFENFEKPSGFYSDSKKDIFLIVTKDNKMGVINIYGKTILPFEFDSYPDVHATYIIGYKKSKCIAVSLEGKILSNYQYDEIRELKLGKYVYFMNNGLIGIATDKFKVLVNARYEKIDLDFDYGDYFLVTYKGRKGFVSNKGIEFWQD